MDVPVAWMCSLIRWDHSWSSESRCPFRCHQLLIRSTTRNRETSILTTGHLLRTLHSITEIIYAGDRKDNVTHAKILGSKLICCNCTTSSPLQLNLVLTDQNGTTIKLMRIKHWRTHGTHLATWCNGEVRAEQQILQHTTHITSSAQCPAQHWNMPHVTVCMIWYNMSGRVSE